MIAAEAERRNRPHYILGLSDSHDAGAVILRDGILVAAVNEERLNRRKMSSGLPRLSVAAVLIQAGISGHDIDAVALAGRISSGAMPMNNDFSFDDGRFSFSQKLAETLDATPVLSGLIRSEAALFAYRNVMPKLGNARLASVRRFLAEHEIRRDVANGLPCYDHHDAHLASAYYSGGIPECLVISNDGFGDALCAKVAIGKGGQLTVISENSFFNSIGVYYNYATELCGFHKAHHAGKTTGLAAFGDPTRTLDTFRRLCHWHPERGRYINHGSIFRGALNLLRRELAGISREDIAAGIQRHLEETIVAMTRHFISKTGLKHVVLVGGVHANVKANQRIAEIDGIESVTIFPNMGDGGLAAGAAWLAWAASPTGNVALIPARLEHVYLGPDIDERQAGDALHKQNLNPYRPDNMADAVAQRLAANKIVARAAGAMEYGPRALGNRSILYSATDASVNTWLNKQLRRTEFMPFAPVCQDIDATQFFKNIGSATAYSAEFMTVTYDVTSRCAAEAPAVVHIDGTARPQIVRRDVNADYYDILTQYKRRTGQSLLVNTSFNMHEEPIVCTATEAMTAFFESDVDSLVLGPFMLDNPRRSQQDE